MAICLIRFGQSNLENPNKPISSFLVENTDTDGIESHSMLRNEVQFSANIICIDVKGRNVRDLSVVDLPGLIANVAEGEDVKNIKLIENLAMKEISRPDSVILLCITMSDDFQNQPSVRLAKEADPTGQRTLGVLTKPDRVEEGVFENWRPVLEGKEQRLHHGYYVVKNPSPKQLKKMNHEQARASEKAFFREDKWASLGSSITSRLGSDRLALKLASLLEQLIKLRLPNIVKEVKTLHVQVKKELEKLPVEIKERQALSTLNSMIRSFEEDFKNELLESQEDNGLADDVDKLGTEFWKAMLDDRPIFLPVTRIELEKLDNDDLYGLQGKSELIEASRYLFEEDKLDLKGRDIQYITEVDDNRKSKLWSQLVKQGRSATTCLSNQLEEASGPLVLTLTEVKKIKSKATRNVLPKNTPWHVKAALIKMSIANWSFITLETLKKIEELVLKGCNDLIAEHFGRFQAGNLEATIGRIMEDLVSSTAQVTKKFLLGLVQLESLYTTINTQDFVKQQKSLSNCFIRARNACTYEDSVYTGKKHNYATKAVLTDNVNEELELAAEIRAYWQLAFKRFTDNARSAYLVMFIQALANDTLDILSDKLGMFDDSASSQAKIFLQEDANIIQIRAALVAKEAILAQGLEVINAFSTGSP